MAKYVQWITYKGKEILFLDAAGKGSEEGLAGWEEMRQEVSKRSVGPLILVDGTNAKIEPAALKKASGAVDLMKKMPGTPVAFVGMGTFLKTGTQLMATRLRMDAHFCNTLEEGKEWLAGQADKGAKP